MYAFARLRTIRASFGTLKDVIRTAPKRHESIVYRGMAPPAKRTYVTAEILTGAMWFWILWRFYHEPEDVLGHNPWPDASKWTDEELGIPPDDED